MTFRMAFPVAINKDLGEGAYSQGLRALKAVDRERVRLSNPRLCHGSGDIDTRLAAALPNAARWDYVVAHDNQLHFVEVHPAHTSEVSQIKNKKDWLTEWLRDSEVGQLAVDKHFHWVASGKIAITKNSKQARAAAQMGLKPIRLLTL